nr:udp-glucuronate 4-epimerase 3 [Quercus suber]
MDRALANEGWMRMFANAKVAHISSIESDHCMLCLQWGCGTRQRMRQGKMFRFEAIWLRDPRCPEVVNEAWERGLSLSSDFPIQNCLQACRESLQRWNKLEFGHVGRRIFVLRSTLQRLHPDQHSEEIRSVRKELNSWLDTEEVMWKQRSRNLYLIASDRNTHFFHIKASNRNQKNLIEGMEDSSGLWQVTPEAIEGQFFVSSAYRVYRIAMADPYQGQGSSSQLMASFWSICDECGIEVESSGHVFWHCARAKEVWSAANVEFGADLGEVCEFLDLVWYARNVKQWSFQALAGLCTIAWGIWTNRNEIRTSGARKSASTIARWTLDYLVEFQVANHKIQQAAIDRGGDYLFIEAAGFVVIYVFSALKWREDSVVGIDNFNEFYDPTLKRTRQALLEYSGVLIVEGDINDMMLLKKLFELMTFTHVLHLAAQAGVRYAMENPLSYVHSNLAGFVNLFEVCKSVNPQSAILWDSSSLVYGLNTKVPLSGRSNILANRE